MEKRVLVLSNNCFSKSGANGRTLEKIFCDYKKENIAQIYIKPERPDFDFCNNYYCITDKDMVLSILFRKSGKILKNTSISNIYENTSVTVKNKTVSKCLIRNLVWNLGNWKSKQLNKWLNTITPDFIFFQAGDSPFMYKIARTISIDLKIPLIFYNTEGYIFKNFNYIEKKLKSDFLYDIYHNILKRQYEKTLIHSKKIIYNCEKIKLDSDKLFNVDSEIIMTSSSHFYYDNNYCHNTFCYAGNLGVGRADALILLAKYLYEINNDFCIDIYGKATKEIIKKLKIANGINYCGFVNYKKINDIYHKHQFLIHVESFEEFYIKDLEYAFSTKIADLLASNRVIISFSPDNYASAQYFKKYDASFQINTKNSKDVKDRLKLIIENSDLQNRLIKNAKYVSITNHNEEKSKVKFNSIVNAMLFKENTVE